MQGGGGVEADCAVNTAITPKHAHLLATCRCGTVQLEAVGAPILTAACHCSSCQEAGRQIEQLNGASPVLDPDGGTGVILYRKDRVQCVKGLEALQGLRLKPESPTRRVLAVCCNSAMFLDFTKGHWLSMYRNRFAPGAPPIRMRVMTKGRRAGGALDGDVPAHPGVSGKVLVKLLSARIAMGFRKADIAWLEGIRER